LFVRDIWPEARLLLYAEFFYRYIGLDADFDPEFQKPSKVRAVRTSSRQAAQLLTLHAAHAAVAPTQWQADTYPPYFRHLLSVCHDGIDSVRIQPGDDATVQLPGMAEPLRRGEEILTFVNRNLEPYRGYHTFMRALPEVLKRRPNARVVIVGSDSVSYGAPAPKGSTWKQIFLDEVRDRLDLSRVHFVGHLHYNALVDLFRVTRVHAYLTYPFVLSWSMLEAMAAGAVVVGSRTGPVEEVIRDGFNGRLVDFFDVKAWSETLVECLAEPGRFEEMRRAARWTIVDRYDLRTRCLPRMIGLVEGLASSSGGVVAGRGERAIVARA
jgi:glycosyltransferase involved in cell wall biosynthesis